MGKGSVILPMGAGAFDVGLVDRFGNDLGTKQVSANANWDLRTLTPYNFGEMFLDSQADWATSLYTDSEARAAILWLVDALDAADIWEEYLLFNPCIGDTMAKRLLNLKYPFDDPRSFRAIQVGTVNHPALGFEFIGAGAIVFENLTQNYLSDMKNYSIGWWQHTDNRPSGQQQILQWGSGTSINNGDDVIINPPISPQIGLNYNGINMAITSFVGYNDFQRLFVSGVHSRSLMNNGTVFNASNVTNANRPFGTLKIGGRGNSNTGGSDFFANFLINETISIVSVKNAMDNTRRTNEAAILATFQSMLNK